MMCKECNQLAEMKVLRNKPPVQMRCFEGTKVVERSCYEVTSTNLCIYHRKEKEGLFDINWADVRAEKLNSAMKRGKTQKKGTG